VPELSHDTAEDGFHEIQLSGKQLVFLFIVTTSVVVGVFLFGVLVGRGARDPKADEAAPVTSSEPAPSPAAGSGPPALEAPVPVDEAPAGKLDYTKRLTDQAPAPESLKAPAETPKAPPPAPVAPKETARETVAKPETPAAAPARSPAPAPVPAATPAALSAAQPGTWLVQVIATRDQAVANSVVRKLTSKGYPAFLVNPVAGAPQPFYKVQVGRYRDRSEAEQVSVRIKKEEQFQSWILR
jgi:cell division septation protein DedD